MRGSLSGKEATEVVMRLDVIPITGTPDSTRCGTDPKPLTEATIHPHIMPSVYKSATITGPHHQHLLFLRLVLVSRDLGVFPLCLFHETGESIVLYGGDGLGLMHMTERESMIECQSSKAGPTTCYRTFDSPSWQR
jgi:hypothetical protein